ncbi:hypothetical protein BX070DRAFT_72352 [Coemansia spiralis]|nr:hypothetical protein BX070DRAFT_72352 [Coemansia spiralis]
MPLCILCLLQLLQITFYFLSCLRSFFLYCNAFCHIDHGFSRALLASAGVSPACLFIVFCKLFWVSTPISPKNFILSSCYSLP